MLPAQGVFLRRDRTWWAVRETMVALQVQPRCVEMGVSTQQISESRNNKWVSFEFARSRDGFAAFRFGFVWVCFFGEAAFLKAATREATMVLWWVPEGHVPDVAEAQQRLERLREKGPGPDAFGFSKPYPPPAAES